jgi:hypothetical protein
MASLNLTFLADLCNESFTGMLATVSIPVIETFVAHESCQEASIGRHT